MDTYREIASLWELLLSTGATEVESREAIAEIYSPPRVTAEAMNNP